MAISIIYGPGGSGKSAFQMHVLVKQLRETRRNVCTNLAVLVAELNEWLEVHHPTEKLQLVDRIRILTVAETKEFWKYRGPRRWLCEAGKEYEYTDDPGTYGVCYIIDEAGAAGFSSQGWAAGGESRSPRGVQCTAYLDQQRKYGDDVFASTNGRTPAQIAKGFRDKAHYFIKLKNGYLHKMGIFKGPAKFTWRQYTEEPGPTSEPMAEGTFRIGSLMSCYLTEQGVGVLGSNADKGARAKGIPMWTIIPACLVLASSCVFIPLLLGKSVSKFMTGHAQVNAAVTIKAPGVVQDRGEPAPGVVSPGAVPQGKAVPASRDADELFSIERGLWVTGIAYGRGQLNVLLSDGRVLQEGDGILGGVERNYVVLVGGRKIYRRSGSGAKGAPVRQDTEVPAVAVPAVTDRRPIAAEPSPGPAVSPIEHTPPPQQQGSWVSGEDGVQRLRETQTLGTVLGR